MHYFDFGNSQLTLEAMGTACVLLVAMMSVILLTSTIMGVIVVAPIVMALVKPAAIGRWALATGVAALAIAVYVMFVVPLVIGVLDWIVYVIAFNR